MHIFILHFIQNFNSPFLDHMKVSDCDRSSSGTLNFFFKHLLTYWSKLFCFFGAYDIKIVTSCIIS